MQVEIYGDQACTERPSGTVSEVYAKIALNGWSGQHVTLGNVSDGRGVEIYNESDYHYVEWYDQFEFEDTDDAIVDGIYKLQNTSGTVDVTGREFSFVKQIF